MRLPAIASPAELDQAPDRPAVFLLRAGQALSGAHHAPAKAFEALGFGSRAYFARAESARRGGTSRILADRIADRIGSDPFGTCADAFSRRLAAPHAAAAAGVRAP